MTVALVRELYQFNAWAQRRIFDALAGLPAEPYQRDLKSSHGGIHGTLCHIVWAEQLWLTRWLGAPPPAVPQGRDLGSLAEVRARWEDVETKRCQFLDALTEAKLTATLTVQPSTGARTSIPTCRRCNMPWITRPTTGVKSSRCCDSWA